MAMFKAGDIELEIDEDGFIQEPALWNDSVAVALAVTEGVDDLTDRHWKLVRYLREYYLKFGVAPMIREALQGHRLQAERGLRDVPDGSGQGRMQGGRASEAYRVRLI